MEVVVPATWHINQPIEKVTLKSECQRDQSIGGQEGQSRGALVRRGGPRHSQAIVFRLMGPHLDDVIHDPCTSHLINSLAPVKINHGESKLRVDFGISTGIFLVLKDYLFNPIFLPTNFQSGYF